MTSRMDRYKEEQLTNGRSNKNKDLYNTLYSDIKYSDINQVKNIARQVSIEEIRDMLMQREESYPLESVDEEIFEEKTYDINDVLSKIKDENIDHKRRSIDNSKYEYLNNKKTFEEEQQEVEQLINTISTNSLINKDLAVDLLEDLKSTTMIGKNNKEIDNILQEVKEKKSNEVDTSFLTKSLSKSDFEALDDLNDKVNKNNTIIIVLIILIVLLILGCAIYLFLKLK